MEFLSLHDSDPDVIDQTAKEIQKTGLWEKIKDFFSKK